MLQLSGILVVSTAVQWLVFSFMISEVTFTPCLNQYAAKSVKSVFQQKIFDQLQTYTLDYDQKNTQVRLSYQLFNSTHQNGSKSSFVTPTVNVKAELCRTVKRKVGERQLVCRQVIQSHLMSSKWKQIIVGFPAEDRRKKSERKDYYRKMRLVQTR